MDKNKFRKQINLAFQERRPRLLRTLDNLLFYLALIGIGVLIFDVGFVHASLEKTRLSFFYDLYACLIFLILTIRLLLVKRLGLRRGWFIVEYLLILLLVAGMASNFFSDQLPLADSLLAQYLKRNFFTSGVIFYVFLIELSKRTLNVYEKRFNPALLFVASFLVLVFVGAGLLLLPRATVGGISLVDALFTSTSAVCVTGLIVVDTATYFTSFGQAIILLLIQIGALGIMTFTSFLGVFFLKAASFRNQLFMQDLVNEDNIGQTMQTIGNIIRITLLIEALGVAFIFLSVSGANFDSAGDRMWFALFHAISAFCNAGFSTLTEGLYDVRFRFSYGFQLVLIGLIVIGGIGFPILFNGYRYLRYMVRNRFRQLALREEYVHTSRMISVHTKLVVYTTAALLVAGTLLYFLTEYHSTLREHTGAGKLVAAFFGSVTPRTAGFNIVDMGQLTVPTVLVYLLLMWIGGSPASTAGGIKTTTFAVAILNTFSVARGKDRVEVFSREVSNNSVRRAFAVMLLSFLVIGVSVLLMAYFDPGAPLIGIGFEAFSAFSTVGLSLNLTGTLSEGSKVVLIVTMFLGRVGTFTLLASMLTKPKTLSYRYPSESIIIT